MSAAALKEGAQFGQYQLIKRIAVGGMAEIHLARTVSMGAVEKLLALKVINPKHSADQEFIDMLIDEAKISVQLSHVNICQTFDLGCLELIYYIAMEFIDGKDLYQVLVKCADLDVPIPFELIAFIGMELSAGLHYAHTKMDNYGRPLEIIHRDVSPQNVLVSYDGEVKIVDFGIAKASQRSRETENGVIKGKFFYMSPEQAWGDPVDARTDVFSAGICLYEMICGEMLYQEEKALQLLDKVRKAEIPSMRARRPDLPQELEAIVLKALAQKKEERYANAAELQAALSGFLYRNYPGFNRTQVSSFMSQIFGNQRFVLPMPGQDGRSMPVEPMREANDFSAISHSVIHEMSPEERQGRASINTSSIPQPQARPFPGSPTNPLAAQPVQQRVGVPAQQDFDPSEDDEHTIAETFWDSTNSTLEPTGALQVDPDMLSSVTSGAGAPIGQQEETPTRLFTRPDIADLERPQPKSAQAVAVPAPVVPDPDPPMAATVGLSIPEAEIAALGLGDPEDGPGPTRTLPSVESTGALGALPPTSSIPMATPIPQPAVPQPVAPQPTPVPSGRTGKSGKPLPPKKRSGGSGGGKKPIPPKRERPEGRPSSDGLPQADQPAARDDAAKKPRKKRPTSDGGPPSKNRKPRNRAEESGRPTITGEGPPKSKRRKKPSGDQPPAEAADTRKQADSQAADKKAADKKGKGEKPKRNTVNKKGRRRKKSVWQLIFGPVGITTVMVLALTGYVVWKVVAPEIGGGSEVVKSATLVINSTPPGAEIFFNGTATGKNTPASLTDVETGATHMVILKREGYEDHQEQVKIRADALTDGKHRMSAFLKRSGGTLILNTIPPGAQVFIDGRFIGDTPLKKTGLNREKEEFRVLLTKEGYEQRQDVLRWNEDTTIELKDLKLEPSGR
ncbi:MAG: protein kinase domain-containing protein [Bradymonadia bacterium]